MPVEEGRSTERTNERATDKATYHTCVEYAHDTHDRGDDVNVDARHCCGRGWAIVGVRDSVCCCCWSHSQNGQESSKLIKSFYIFSQHRRTWRTGGVPTCSATMMVVLSPMAITLIECQCRNIDYDGQIADLWVRRRKRRRRCTSRYVSTVSVQEITKVIPLSAPNNAIAIILHLQWVYLHLGI